MKFWQQVGIGIGGSIAALLAWRALRPARVVKPGDPCFPSSRYTADCSSGKRKVAPTLIVVHSTEGINASGAAGEFTAPHAGGSTHLVVGEDGNYRFLADDVIPCGAPGANDQGLHIELAGFAAWTRAQWLARAKTLDCAAAFLAAWSDQYGIPLRFVDAAGLLRGERGVTTHAEVSKVWRLSDHWDPGPGFPMDVLLSKAG